MESPKHSGDTKPTKRRKASSSPQDKPMWWAEENPTGWDRVQGTFRQAWDKARAGHGSTLEEAAQHSRKSESNEGQGEVEAMPATHQQEPVDRDFTSGNRVSAAPAKDDDPTDPSLHIPESGHRTAQGSDEQRSQAERAAKYGFAARAHFPEEPEWTPKLESSLKGDWHRVGSSRSWEESREDVRAGFYLSKPKPT